MRMIQEYVGVPPAISKEARELAAQYGVSASEVLREMIVAGRREGARRIRERGAVVSEPVAA